MILSLCGLSPKKKSLASSISSPEMPRSVGVNTVSVSLVLFQRCDYLKILNVLAVNVVLEYDHNVHNVYL